VRTTRSLLPDGWERVELTTTQVEIRATRGGAVKGLSLTDRMLGD